MVQITNIGEGKVVPGTGQARFKTTYTAVVMKPFKGEVVDGKVVNVNKVSSVFYLRDARSHEADGLLRYGRPITGLRLITCQCAIALAIQPPLTSNLL